MNILILGGTGFIGSHIARRFLGQGNKVAVFHRGRTTADLPATAIQIPGDRARLAEVAPAFRSFAPEVVIDACAYSQRDAELMVETFSGLAQRAVCLSSMDVYRAYGIFRRLEAGPPDPKPFGEEAPLRTSRYPYRSAAAGPGDFLFTYDKVLVEKVVLSEPRLPATILRLPQVFGPNDSQHRLGDYLKQMDSGNDVLLDEDRAGWRWTRGYVEDVAFAVELAANSRNAAGRIYNVGEPFARTEREWIEKVGVAAGWTGKVKLRRSLSEPADESYDWRQDLAADTTRIRTELGYHETMPLEDALERSIAWERAHAVG